MKGTATHFIEQYESIDNVHYFTKPNTIEYLKNCLEKTSSTSFIRTVAVFYITPKKAEEPT